MAEAKEKGHDCVITIGGIQSNHARATVRTPAVSVLWRVLFIRPCARMPPCLFCGTCCSSAPVPGCHRQLDSVDAGCSS